MNKNNKSPDEYHDENERCEEFTRRLRMLFSDQNWLPVSRSWWCIFISYDAADRDLVIEIARKYGLPQRPDRDTLHFGYDSWWEGVED